MGQKAPDAARTDAQGRSVREPLRRDDANKTHLRRWPTVHSRTRRCEHEAQRIERRTHPRATADRKARPPARDANDDARARTRDQFVRNALRRSLARLRSDEDPGRAASASSSDDRMLAKGGFGGCPRRRHPPSARARAVSGGFFFLLFVVLPDRDFAISRDREIARDGWRRRSRESRESRYGSRVGVTSSRPW